MARYLSPEWFEEVNAAAPAPAAGTEAAAPLVLQQVVTGGPRGEVRYWVRVGAGRVEVGLGEADDADASITQSYDTAVAIATGELTVQAAVLAGRIRISGDVAALVRRQEALHGIDLALADVRRRTSYA